PDRQEWQGHLSRCGVPLPRTGKPLPDARDVSRRNVMETHIPQLRIMQSLQIGFAVDQLDAVLARCGANRDMFQGLLDWSLVEEKGGFFVLTKTGREQYQQLKRLRQLRDF